MKQGDQWASAFAEMIKRINSQNKEANVRLATVTNLKPFTIVYNGVPFSVDKDIIFVNGLMLDENINLPVDDAMAGTQTFDQFNPPPLISTAPQTSSTYTGTISGTIPDFIKEFYNYFKAWHNRYILHVGDIVAVQKIGKNKFIVLQKVQQAKFEVEQQ